MVKAQRSQPIKHRKTHKETGCKKGKGCGVKRSKDRKSELRGKKKKDKKESHRHRKKTLAVGDGEALDCCVLLTRLDDKGVVGKDMDARKRGKQKSVKVRKKKLHCSSRHRRTKPGLARTSATNHQALEPKTHQSDALLMSLAPVFEPRMRRMAALNAEAFNSLLLYRNDTLASNLTKKKQQPSTEDPAVDIITKKPEHRGGKTKKVAPGGKADPKDRPKKKQRRSAEPQDIDWLALFAPTPRRQAGLTAATLLKLTSSTYGTKRQKKTETKPGEGSNAAATATATIQDEVSGKTAFGDTTLTKSLTHPKHEDQLKHRKQGTGDPAHSQPSSTNQGCCCSLCRSEASDPEWKGQECIKRPLHCGGPPSSSLGFSLKTIKEEQVEAEVSSSSSCCYCCCSQDRCVEYCHRLALFLDDKTSFKEPSEDGSLSSEVFHHHHHHHHHHHLHHHHLQSSAAAHPASITISPHTYGCFPGYYVHFSHSDSPRPPISPLALCPRGSKRPKLLPSPGPQQQPSGLSRPVYCCTSVEACYGGEPCRISGYSAYTNVIPSMARRGCSFSPADCTVCSHGIKRDPSTLADHHSPSSVPICSSPRTLSGCPVPTAPPAGQSVPHVQAPLSDSGRPRQGRALQVARECPQTAKKPHNTGSKSGAGITALDRDQEKEKAKAKKKKKTLCSANVGGQTLAKQFKNGRRKSTNGWRPVGLPFQREVFSVGEEAPVLRKCFEGVQRDGELIRVRDTVLLKSGPRKKTLPFVAKISSLWEEPETGELMMSLFWYYRPEHTQGGRSFSLLCENEIFASRHQDVNSVACIEDKCYVLTLAQYCRFCALVKRRREGVRDCAASLVVPPVVGSAMPDHHCVPDDVDPDLVFFCRHVYDFRYGRLLKNLQ